MDNYSEYESKRVIMENYQEFNKDPNDSFSQKVDKDDNLWKKITLYSIFILMGCFLFIKSLYSLYYDSQQINYFGMWYTLSNIIWILSLFILYDRNTLNSKIFNPNVKYISYILFGSIIITLLVILFTFYYNLIICFILIQFISLLLFVKNVII